MRWGTFSVMMLSRLFGMSLRMSSLAAGGMGGAGFQSTIVGRRKESDAAQKDHCRSKCFHAMNPLHALIVSLRLNVICLSLTCLPQNLKLLNFH